MLDRDRRLGWILDPAHFAVMGQDPFAFLERYGDRLRAVHLKDWVPWYGRSYHSYARGFRELGRGRVPLKSLLDHLKNKVRFGRWAILEQDTLSISPESSISVSVEWLLANGHARGRLKSLPYGPPDTESRKLRLGTRQVTAANAIILGQETPELFPDLVTQCAHQLVDAHLVSLWAYNPLPPSLSLVAATPGMPEVRWLRLDDAACGKAVRTKSVARILELPRKPHLDRLRDEYGVQWLISVPIRNRFNPNDVELVLNIFPKTEPTVDSDFEQNLTILARHIALTAESILADRCMRATGAIRELYLEKTERDEFLRACLQVVREAVNAEGVTVFLESKHATRLVVAATTGVQWRDSKQAFYEKSQGRTGLVWSTNCERISFQEMSRVGVSREASQPIANDSTVFVPLRDYGGNAIGVLRCQNKLSPRFPNGACFSQEDVTVLQAICDAIYPRLALFEAEIRTMRMFAKVTHELKTPIVAIRADLDFIEHECQTAKLEMHENYVDEARDVTDLMAMLIENAEVALQQLDHELPSERPQHLFLMGDIVAPLVDQMKHLLRRNGLKGNSISYAPTNLWDIIPKLWVKPSGLRQVFFNLINNAIKYRGPIDSDFCVKIRPRGGISRDGAEQYHIDIEDAGPGVEPDERELIFEWGRRGRNAERSVVTGSGFGLPIARQVMFDHGGDLKLTSPRRPTRFTLTFPGSLRWNPYRIPDASKTDS